MILDGQININTIVQILGFLFFGFAAWTQLRAAIEVLKANYTVMSAQIVEIKTDIGKLTEISKTTAIQNQRLDSLDTRITEKNERLNLMEKRLTDFSATFHAELLDRIRVSTK
jgi:cell division protein FtsB